MLNRGHVDCRLTPCWLECSGEFAAAFPTGSVLHDLRATRVAKENMRTQAAKEIMCTQAIYELPPVAVRPATAHARWGAAAPPAPLPEPPLRLIGGTGSGDRTWNQ